MSHRLRLVHTIRKIIFDCSIIENLYLFILKLKKTMMNVSIPIFYGSWKGKVIDAIAVNNAKSWEDIRELTRLNPKHLNKVLAELFELDILEKNEFDEYRVVYDIYREYKDYSQTNNNPNNHRPESNSKSNKNLVKSNWLDNWIKLNKPETNLTNKHFFLEGDNLQNLSIQLIKNAKTSVLIVNPFVDETSLSKKLIGAASSKVKTTLVTRSPDKQKKEFHNLLREKGVKIHYKKTIHAKLLVIDSSIAVASSMNFTANSTSGKNWEAGIVSLEQQTIQQIIDSITNIIKN